MLGGEVERPEAYAPGLSVGVCSAVGLDRDDSLRDLLQLTALGKGLPVIARTQAGQIHSVAIDGDVPGLACLLTVIHPAHAKKVACDDLHGPSPLDVMLARCYLARKL